MRIFLVGCGLVLILGIAVACFVGVVVIAVSMESVIQAPVIRPSVPDATPAPDCPDCKPKEPEQPKQPSKPRKPWVMEQNQPVGLVSAEQLPVPFVPEAANITKDGFTHNGAEVTTDLPTDLLVKNTGGMGMRGPGTGAGLCVFTSGQFAAWWQNEPVLMDLQKWMTTKPGGGTPMKVDDLLPKKYAEAVEAAKKAGKPIPQPLRWIHYQGRDPSILWAALKSGRMPAITYGYGHMTSLWGRDKGQCSVRDNNFVGDREVLWMDEQTFIHQWTAHGYGWAWILCNPRPPAPPRHPTMQVVCEKLSAPFAASLQAPFINGSYKWTRVEDDQDQWALWRDGRQVGAYDAEVDRYIVRRGPGDWGKSYRRPPVPLPQDAYDRLTEEVAPGVLWEDTPPFMGKDSYSFCGKEITKDKAFELIDDSAKLSLTVIGTPEENERFRLDLERPENVALKSHVVFQAYQPDNWAVARYGFDCTGHPSVYLEDSVGNVKWHINHYSGPTDMFELRQKDPLYKPANDPGMPNAPMPLESDWGPLPLLALMGGGGTFFLSLLSGFGALVHAIFESLNTAAETDTTESA